MLASLLPQLAQNIEVYVLSRDVTPEDFSDGPDASRRIQVVDPSQSPLLDALLGHGFSGKTHVSADAAAKLMVPFLFPDKQRVLYLDGDMVCCSEEINQLFSMDLGSNLVAAVPDFKLAYCPFRAQLGIREENIYFNSGLILFDIPQCRKHLAERLIVDRTRVLAPIMRFVDQDTLNYIYRNRVERLDMKFNVFANVHVGKGLCKPVEDVLNDQPELLAFSREDIDSAMQNRVVLHYTSAAKPWHTQCGHEDLWWEIATRLELGLERAGRPVSTAHTNKTKKGEKSSSGKHPSRGWKGRAARWLRKVLEVDKRDKSSREISRDLVNLKQEMSSLRKNQSQLVDDVQAVQSRSVRYPVILDLRWVETLRDLADELERVGHIASFENTCAVLTSPQWQPHHAALARSFGLRFCSELHLLEPGWHFVAEVFELAQGRAGTYWELVGNGRAEGSGKKHWLQIRPGDEAPDLDPMPIPELGVSLLQKLSAPRYDSLVSRYYRQAATLLQS
jgi:lipopolysaccharide biosynthesis glycosyltransferase